MSTRARIALDNFIEHSDIVRESTPHHVALTRFLAGARTVHQQTRAKRPIRPAEVWNNQELGLGHPPHRSRHGSAAQVITVRYRTGSPSLKAGVNRHVFTPLNIIMSGMRAGPSTSWTRSTVPSADTMTTIRFRMELGALGPAAAGINCGNDRTGGSTLLSALEYTGDDSGARSLGCSYTAAGAEATAFGMVMASCKAPPDLGIETRRLRSGAGSRNLPETEAEGP